MKKIWILTLVALLVSCNSNNNVAENNKINIENEPSANSNNENEVVEEEVIVEPEVITFDDTIDGVHIEDGNYPIGKTTIRYLAKDDLMITADLYLIDETSPFIILFHQAGYSRGEYLETAARLNTMGYNALAVDQRSGDQINDVINLTAKRAYEAGYGINYIDAQADVIASIEYILDNFDTDLYLVGSSYTTVLILATASEYEEQLNGLLVFSPGDYFSVNDLQVMDYAKNLTLPVFASCGSHESYESEIIFKSVGSEVKTFFVPRRLVKHASTILWSENENSESVWEALTAFLDSTK